MRAWARGLGVLLASVALAAAPSAVAADDEIGGLATELRSRLVPPVDVVVVGNSKVRTDLDLAVLPGQLPGPKLNFVPMGVPGTAAPVWYAVASEHVYGAGARPHALVVYGTLAGALVTTLPAAPARARLAQLLTPASPTLLARPFGAPLTSSLLAAYTTSGGNACTPGRTRPPELPAPVEPLPVASSYLAALTTLAQERGARLLFVRQPVAPSGALDDTVSRDDELAARALVRRAGGGWIDLRSELRSELLYGDGVHMSEAGRTHATAAFARALAALGDWIPRRPAFPADPPEGPEAPVWVTPPAASALPFVEAGACAATAAVPPGLAAVSPEAVARAGYAGASPVRVRLGKRELSLGAAASGCDGGWSEAGGVVTAAVAADRQRALTLGVAEGAEARGEAGLVGWWAAPGVDLRATVPAGRVFLGGWAPEGGAALTVDGAPVRVPGGRFRVELAAGAGVRTVRSEAAWVLVAELGPHVAPAPATIDLRGAALDVSGAPALSPVPLRPVPGRPWAAAGDASALTVPGADETMDASGVGGCAPLRAPGLEVALARGRVTVSRSDCSAVDTDTPLRLELPADRGCPRGPGRWLYPGDRQVWTVPAGPAGRWSLELGAGVLGGQPGARVEVRVDDDQGELARTSFLAEQMRSRGERIDLGRSPVGSVRVTLVSPATAPWLLFGRAALVGSGP